MSDIATKPATCRETFGGALERTIETALVPAKSPTHLAAQSSADILSITATHNSTVDTAHHTTE